MTLPDGWHREYQGRHGAEFFYEPRNVTMSVLPRYDSASGRASQKAPSRYVVRIHQLLARGGSKPVTLGEREAFDDALDLARTYMERVNAVGVRSERIEPLEAFTDVATYDDDTLLALARSKAGSPVTALVHADRDVLDVAHTTGESPATTRDRLRERVAAFRAGTLPGDEATYVTRAGRDLAWFPMTERGDDHPDAVVDGTLLEFDDADAELGAFLDELTAFVRRRPRRRTD